MKLIDLCKLVSQRLGEGSTLLDLYPLLDSYDGTEWRDCQKYRFCCQKYARHQVYQDDRIQVLVICWDKQQQSGVHDHPDNGCLLKLMRGNLVEEVWEIDDTQRKLVRENHLSPGQISYQEGKSGLHNIINLSDTGAISLHIYSPPLYTPTFY